jgi:acetylornithine deacetylase/succinyl-diaminopimelate desuccinylase-like protein
MIALLVAAFASEPTATPPHVLAAREAVDWAAVTDEAAGWLSDYIQIDTVAPPGNERDGAVFLADILRDEGFTTELVDHGDNRASLIARYATGSTKRPLCLLSHIDVVPSEPDRWSRPPLSGAIEDGHVWGRGAIDMKGMGIMEVAAAVQIARAGLPLDRDLVVLAVADEEVAGLGAKTLAADHWDRIDCVVILNEGGLGQRDALFEGQVVHAISVAERGALWVRLVAEGEPGHGSVFADQEAPTQLLAAMERVARKYQPKTVLSPPIVEMLERIGAHKGGLVGGILRSGLGRQLIVKGQLAKSNPSLVQTTVHLTGMSGASSTNVVPSEVWASYDCRLLPGVEPEELLAELEELTADIDGVRWEVLSAFASNSSPWDDPAFERLAHYAVEGEPDGVATPLLSPGFTDSLFLRPVGAKAYGYIPVIVTAEERATMHGDDERISLQNLERGAKVIHSWVLDVAGTGDPGLGASFDRIPVGTDTATVAAELTSIDALLRDDLSPQERRWMRRRALDRLTASVRDHGWPADPAADAVASRWIAEGEDARSLRLVKSVADRLAAVEEGADPASIALELAARVAVDQRIRRALGPDAPQILVETMGRVDEANTTRMKALVQQNGWPTVSRYGADAAHDAWLLVQHADRDRAFQADMLARMAPLVATGEVSGKDVAYLTDRLASARDEPQVYGTQGRCDMEAEPYPTWVPNPIVDAEQVDARRASVGLVPMATYVGWFDCEGLRLKGRAAYEAKDWRTCESTYLTAAERSTRPATDHYNAACCAALGGRPDAAFAHLEAAFAAGADPDAIAADADFTSLHGDPRWPIRVD